MKKITIILLAALTLASCGQKVQLLDDAAFTRDLDGQQITLYTLRNENGMTAQISNYGARIVALWVPAKSGFRNVIDGYDNLDGYMTPAGTYQGATLGRFAGLIGAASVTIDSVAYTLSENDNGNHLNGGATGFNARTWDAVQGKDESGNDMLTLTYLSVAGEMGYPGTLNAQVVYTLTAENQLQIDFSATTDATTIVNLANQITINLHGRGSKEAAESNKLILVSKRYLETGENFLPTGKILPIEEGSELDFSNFRAWGSVSREIDQTFVLRKAGYPGDLEMAATLYEAETGIIMDLLTSQRTLRLRPNKGLMIRAAGYPDAPNHPGEEYLGGFTSTELRPDTTYSATTVYAFRLYR